MILRSVTFSFLLVFCAVVQAIDETESLRQRSQTKPQFTSLTLDIAGKSGNSDTEEFAFGVFHSQRINQHFAFVMASREYAESNGVESANAAFLHLRYNYYLDDKRAIEVFTQSNRDDFRSLESRELVGLAYRQELNTHQAMGIGLFNEWEEYSVNDITEKYKQSRINFYWVIAQDISENAQITNTLYYQPSVREFNDWRAFNQLNVRSKLYSGIYLRLGLLIEHDSQPVLNVEKTDVSYQAGLDFEF